MLSGKTELMADYPVSNCLSRCGKELCFRLPLFSNLRLAVSGSMKKNSQTTPLRESYEKLIIRCSFGIINAGRNSV